MADKTEAPMLEALAASKKATPIQPSKRYVGQRTAVELKKVQKETGGIEVDAIQRESIPISSFLLKIIKAYICVVFFLSSFSTPCLLFPHGTSIIKATPDSQGNQPDTIRNPAGQGPK